MTAYRALKLQLLAKDPHCHWCKRPVSDYGDRTLKRMNGLPDPDDMATIDHTVSRFHRKKGEVVEKVLACVKCNTERSTKENRMFNETHKRKLKMRTYGPTGVEALIFDRALSKEEIEEIYNGGQPLLKHT